MIRETDQLQPALLLLIPYRLPAIRLFRRNNATVRIDGRVVKFGMAGLPDFHGVVDGGLHVEIEIKAARGRLSPEQKVFRDWCVEHRVPYVNPTARVGETIEQTVERWCDEIGLAVGLCCVRG